MLKLLILTKEVLLCDLNLDMELLDLLFIKNLHSEVERAQTFV